MHAAADPGTRRRPPGRRARRCLCAAVVASPLLEGARHGATIGLMPPSRRRRLVGHARRRAAALIHTAGDVARAFGWMYVTVLAIALLILGYLLTRDVMGGREVAERLIMVPLAFIWPLAALTMLRGQGAAGLTFPMNVIVLAVCTGFIINGWTVLILAVRDLFRWRPRL
jgi:hypothetical protein